LRAAIGGRVSLLRQHRRVGVIRTGSDADVVREVAKAGGSWPAGQGLPDFRRASPTYAATPLTRVRQFIDHRKSGWTIRNRRRQQQGRTTGRTERPERRARRPVADSLHAARSCRSGTVYGFVR